MGLSAIEVYLDPRERKAAGELRLAIRPELGSAVELAWATLPIQAVVAPGYYRFDFSPQRDSWQVYYAVELELYGTGELAVGHGPAESYLDGAAHSKGEQVEAQVSFRLVYDTLWAIVGLGVMIGEWSGLSLAGLALFTLPGWAALTWWWPQEDALAWPVKFGLATGLSVALYPVLMLWTHLAGLQLGPLYAWGPVVGGAVAMGWKLRHSYPDNVVRFLTSWLHSDTRWANATLAFVVALVFGVRYWLVRSQEAPMWGDSVHHTMIAQLMLDNSGLFNAWLPYAELSTFTYHFGFHSAVAALVWLTGLDTLRAVIWTGQILNGLAVLALWPLVARVSQNRWAAVIVVLIAGLLSPMPNYYVNWGRYTQLAGQVILPAAMTLAWWLTEQRCRIPRAVWVLGAFAWGGLALTHYRILIFGVLFVGVVALWALGVWRDWRILVQSSLLGLCSMAVFAPWFVRVFGGRWFNILTRQVTTAPAALTDFERQYNSVGDITAFLPIGVWSLLFAAILLALLRRNVPASLMTVWGLIALIAANPQWLGMPGSGVLSNPALLMGVYILAGVVIGGVGGWGVIALTTCYPHRLAPLMLCIGFCIIAIGGLQQRFGDYRPDLHAMVTRPDQRAAEWIRANTPQEARFLVNDFFAYGGGLVVGSDAGWWLPLLTSRLGTLPPMIYATEHGSVRSDLAPYVNTRAAILHGLGPRADEAFDMLVKNGVTHVYIGQRQGLVGTPVAALLDPQELVADGRYRLVYHVDRVYVFELAPQP
jgi:hypothetical protein